MGLVIWWCWHCIMKYQPQEKTVRSIAFVYPRTYAWLIRESSYWSRLSRNVLKSVHKFRVQCLMIHWSNNSYHFEQGEVGQDGQTENNAAEWIRTYATCDSTVNHVRPPYTSFQHHCGALSNLTTEGQCSALYLSQCTETPYWSHSRGNVTRKPSVNRFLELFEQFIPFWAGRGRTGWPAGWRRRQWWNSQRHCRWGQIQLQTGDERYRSQPGSQKSFGQNWHTQGLWFRAS